MTVDTLSPAIVADIERATLATINNAPAHVVTWEKTTPKGLTVQHATATATGLVQAPKAVQVAAAQSADLRQLNNGNFSPVREALALFKGKALASIKAAVTQALSVTDGEGNALAPVIPWDNVRAKSHAYAIAQAIAGMPLKGRKAQWAALFAEWC